MGSGREHSCFAGTSMLVHGLHSDCHASCQHRDVILAPMKGARYKDIQEK